ncbi:MAG TPA: hypothetical protein DEQ84_04225, partial [Prevotellaceae bacterium]|nr:hypothetical protein [Prevotellaceae bacterium]
MKKNRMLSFAAGVLLACSINFAYAQTGNEVPPITTEAQQDAQAYLAAVKSNDEKAIAAQK